jgi:hypothetical protein
MEMAICSGSSPRRTAFALRISLILCWQPFRREPDFGVTSVNDGFNELLARASHPF